MTKEFFFDEAGDQRMEKQNIQAWQALASLIENEALSSLPKRPLNVLDIGCHTGGFLELLSKRWNPMKHIPPSITFKSLSGVEPLESPRQKVLSKMEKCKIFKKIEDVPDQSANLVVGHEFLYLVEDLEEWVSQLKRILRPEGGAYISLGSHGENTAWLRWRKQLLNIYGHHSYVYSPMDILDNGIKAGFEMELHRLYAQRRTSIRYSPPEDGWGEFVSAKEALDFQDQKYVFVFYPKND